MVNAAVSLPLWDVVDDCIVTSTGALYRVVELRGLDPDCTPDATWMAAYDGLREGFRGIPTDTLLQFILDRSSETELEAGDGEGESGELSEVLQYQRRQRARFLRRRNIRRHRTYLAYGYRWGVAQAEFARVDESVHRRQVERLDELGERLTSVLLRGRMRSRQLDANEIWQLLARQTRPDRKRPFTVNPGPIWPRLSPREQLLASDVRWTDDHVRMGDLYYKVLSIKQLPSHTDPLFWRSFTERVAEKPEGQRLDFDHRICLNLTFPSKGFVWWLYELGVRVAHMLAHKEEQQAKDPKAEGNEEDMQSLGKDLRDGERLVNVGIQVAVWAPSVRELKRRSLRVQNAFQDVGVDLLEESMAHQDELFKTVAGMASRFDRWRLVTSRVAADLIPNDTYSVGDPNPTLVLERPESRTRFGVGVRDIRGEDGSKARVNDHFLLFGETGVGKSVAVNSLLAYGVLSGPTRGRVVAADYASPEKSSLLVATKIFGGRYVSVSGDGAKINPLPRPTHQKSDGARIETVDFNKLVQITNIVLLNTAATKEDALCKGIIQDSIRRLYERWEGDEAPTYADLYEAMQAHDVCGEEAQRRDRLLGVMRTFMRSAAGSVLNHRSTVTVDGDFVVYDLYGLRDGFEPHERQAVSLAVTQHVRASAFDGHPERPKYALFDEASQLFELGLGETIVEMLRTARAHNCIVGMIDQTYKLWRQGREADTARINTGRKFLMSQGDNSDAREAIAEDFGFTEREREIFARVHTIPGRYADILVRTTVQVKDYAPERVSARGRLYLSPIDEQVVSTAPEDRAAQRALRQAYPEAPRFEILAYLAEEKRKRVMRRAS